MKHPDLLLSPQEFIDSLKNSIEDTNTVLDRIYRKTGDLMVSGKWNELKEILDKFPIELYDETCIIGIMCSTFMGWKPHEVIVAREEYFFRARQVMLDRGLSEEKITKLMGGVRLTPIPDNIRKYYGIQ